VPDNFGAMRTPFSEIPFTRPESAGPHYCLRGFGRLTFGTWDDGSCVTPTSETLTISGMQPMQLW
jgi:hypothetical protein